MDSVWIRVVVVAVVGLVASLAGGTATRAQGSDPCPEPNDAFQAACYLGTGADAFGFIARADDVDAYRFEALDFGVRVRLELADTGGAYRLHLASWNGDIVAESTTSADGLISLEFTLGPPGSYYVFVDSRTGASSETSPYRLGARLTYPGPTLTAVYRHDFSGPVDFQCRFLNPEPRERFCGLRDGRFVFEFPNRSGYAQGVAFMGPAVADFTLSVDVRLQDVGKDNHFIVYFRISEDVEYRFGINPLDQTFGLLRWATGEGRVPLAEFPGGTAGLIDNAGGVNRVVVQWIGSAIRFNVNGADIGSLDQAEMPPGRIGIGAYAVRGSPAFVFDNLLLAVPGQ